MDLPNLLNRLKSAPDEPKKFIAVEISFDAVKSAIWQSTGVHTEVVAVGSVQAWTSGSIDELITAIDTSLADAQASVSDEPDQVIFGLPVTWVDNDGIAEDRKPLLKQICHRLGLKAIGFVVTTEAMVHHLREVEGGPPSAILIQVASQEIATSLVYLGKLEATQVVGRSTSVAVDIEEGLARIPHTGHLPSRMIMLTNEDDVESLKQELISYDWQKKLEFLHIPKIEALPKEWSIKAISLAGGSEVIESLGFTNLSGSTKPAKPEVDTDLITEPISSPKPPPEAESEPVPAPEPEFQSEPQPIVAIETSSDALGFTPVDFTAPAAPEPTPLLPPTPEIDNLEIPQPEPKTSLQPPRLLVGFGKRLKQLVARPVAKSQSPSPRRLSKKWLLPAVVSLIVIGVVGGAVQAYLTLPHAQVSAYISSNPYTQPVSFTVSTTAADNNLENLTVLGQKQTVDRNGSKTAATTGSKTVGDRAKGKVVVYNRTTATKTLAAGTVLKTNNLKYTLDTSITVASASTKENADFSTTTEPSKTEAAITAADIGEPYNIAKDTQLAVANFSSDSFIAVTQAAVSGGTARKVAAVSKDDQDNLKKALIAELKTEISQSMQTTSDGSMHQVAVGDPKITDEKYSLDKGEEGDALTLQLKMSQIVYQFDDKEVLLLAQSKALANLPSNTQVKPDSASIRILNATINDQEKALINAEVVLQSVPKVEASEYSKVLVGVPISQVKTKLSAMPNFVRSEVSGKWLLFGRLPLKPQNISLYIKPVSATE